MRNIGMLCLAGVILLGAGLGWADSRKESDNPEAVKYFDSGARKDQKDDSQGALKDYSRAIELDPNFTDAYFLRGRLKRILKDYPGALKDLDKAIALKKDELFYYERAQTYLGLMEYPKAIPDLDAVIKIDPDFKDSLITRGRLRAATGDPTGGCEDMKLAQKRGDHRADDLIPQICGEQKHEGEQLVMDWPDAEKWKVASRQSDGHMVLVELVRGEETLDNWTEFGSVTAVPITKDESLRRSMDRIHNVALKDNEKSSLTFLGEGAKPYLWILFTLERPGAKGEKPEADLYYLAKGKESLYICFRALRKDKLDGATIKKWTAFFKAAEMK